MPDLSQNIQAITTFLFPDLMWDDFVSGDDELLKRFKPTYVPFDKVQYDQFDSPYGILSYRGIGGEPSVVKMASWQKYVLDPGYWGEKTILDESLITRGREPGTLADYLEVRKVTEYYTLQFKTRITSLIRKALADTIRTGTFTNTGPTGQAFVYQISNYSTQLLSPTTTWSNASANFVNDLLGFKANLEKGSSNKFGPGSVLLMNANSIVDIWGQTAIQSTYKTAYGASIIGLDGESIASGLNQVLGGRGEMKQGFGLPTIVIYNNGYYSTLAAAQTRDKTNWNYIIPTRSALWLGERPGGQMVGEFQMTRHAGLVEQGDAAKYPNADDALGGKLEGLDAISEGLYVRVHYQNKQPHQYEEEVGVNGSPVVGYPGAVAAISWT